MADTLEGAPAPDASTRPYTDAMRRRYSCRTCEKTPIDAATRGRLEQAVARHTQGPFGSVGRFLLLAATEDDAKAVKSFGTYGFVRNPTGFILGAVPKGRRSLEDFGYLMELDILEATLLGLGTCWLGGTFTRSRFAQALQPGDDEMPAVVSVGIPREKRNFFDRIIRWNAEGDNRMPWEQLFFDEAIGKPLSKEQAGAHAEPLEMVRRAPSASNRQPWRVVRCGERYDFYLKRTPGYAERNMKLFGTHDLQRVDMGIAMSHFELACRELGLGGKWVEREVASDAAEYLVSWE